VLLADVLALAVDRHRRRDDHAGGHRALGHDVLEEASGGHRVELGVARDLVHRLADAHGGGEVDDLLGALEGAHGGLAVADVADDQLDARREVGLDAAVHLGLEAVEYDHLVAALDERAHQVRADEAGAASDECPHEFLILRRLKSIRFDQRPRRRCSSVPSACRSGGLSTAG
jgi:hypothetical protein